MGEAVIKTFTTMVRRIPANEPILVLGIMELDSEESRPNPAMMRDLFGYSKNNQYSLKRPNEVSRPVDIFNTLLINHRMRDESTSIISYHTFRNRRMNFRTPIIVSSDNFPNFLLRRQIKHRKVLPRSSLKRKRSEIVIRLTC